MHDIDNEHAGAIVIVRLSGYIGAMGPLNLNGVDFLSSYCRRSVDRALTQQRCSAIENSLCNYRVYGPLSQPRSTHKSWLDQPGQ